MELLIHLKKKFFSLLFFIFFHYTGFHDPLEQNNGCRFSTYDLDQDTGSNLHCAVARTGGWWYASCGNSNLNGNFTGKGQKGPKWGPTHAEGGTAMMVRCQG